jgi:ankyrin repeat protein
MKGNAKGIESLIAGGANVNARMSGSQSFAAMPLYLATRSGNVEAVRRLIAAGADIEARLAGKVPSTVLLTAVEKGDTAMVAFLLNPTAGSSAKDRNTAHAKNRVLDVDVDIHGEATAIRTTSKISKGADPNAGIPRAGVMQAPILLAVARGHSEVAKQLLQAGASCNIIVASSAEQAKAGGETLADIAQRRRDYDMMQVLLSFERCNPETVRRAALNREG